VTQPIPPKTDETAETQPEGMENAPKSPVSEDMTAEPAMPYGAGMPDASAETVIPETPKAATAEASGSKTASQTSAVKAVPARRGGFLGMVLGGVCAAALGAGAVIYLLPKLPPEWLPPIAPAVDIAPLEAELAAQKAEIAQLTQKLAAAAKPAPVVDLAPLEDRISALEAAPPAEAVVAPAQDMSAMEAEIAQLRQMIVDGSGAGAAQEQIAAAAKAASERIAAAEKQAQGLQAESQAAAKRALAQAALSHLRASLETGAPAESAKADLAEAGIELPAALSGPVPSLIELRASFAEPARQALAVARRETAGTGTLERLGAFFMAQTGARSLSPQEGSDPDAVLSRADAGLQSGDVATALTEIAALPETAQAELSAWVSDAKAYQAAGDALGALSAGLK
jgi:hypothetical protein